MYCSFFLLVIVVVLVLADDNTTAIKKKVEDVMPIATGHEREELQAELEVFFFFLSFITTLFCLLKRAFD